VTFTMPFDEELFALAMDHSSSPELPALKKRFAGFSICKDMATAAAFGYLAAMRDAKKIEDEQFAPSIGDQICSVLEDCRREEETVEEGMEIIMGLIFGWLKKEFNENGYSGDVIAILEESFSFYVKPGVI
jgi:hypothetical protein